MFCYLSHNYRNLTSAGNKAKSDVELIMQREGYKNVGLKQTHYKNMVLSFLLNLCGVLKAPFCLHAGDVLVLQYPVKKFYYKKMYQPHSKALASHNAEDIQRDVLPAALDAPRHTYATGSGVAWYEEIFPPPLLLPHNLFQG